MSKYPSKIHIYARFNDTYFSLTNTVNVRNPNVRNSAFWKIGLPNGLVFERRLKNRTIKFGYQTFGPLTLQHSVFSIFTRLDRFIYIKIHDPLNIKKRSSLVKNAENRMFGFWMFTVNEPNVR